MSTNHYDRLSSFPAELIDSVYKFFKNSDFENLRLSCKMIQCRVHPILFDTFTLYSHKRSFKSMESIANHEMLRTYVKTLIYDTSFIPTTELALKLVRLEEPPISQALKVRRLRKR